MDYTSTVRPIEPVFLFAFSKLANSRPACEAAWVLVGMRPITCDTILTCDSLPPGTQPSSNHESFAGVGAVLPPRIDLLRVQQLRGLGGNAW